MTAGRAKGLVLLGDEASEEPGSGEMAEWLKGFVTEVPIEWMPAGEPFWALPSRVEAMEEMKLSRRRFCQVTGVVCHGSAIDEGAESFELAINGSRSRSANQGEGWSAMANSHG